MHPMATRLQLSGQRGRGEGYKKAFSQLARPAKHPAPVTKPRGLQTDVRDTGTTEIHCEPPPPPREGGRFLRGGLGWDASPRGTDGADPAARTSAPAAVRLLEGQRLPGWGNPDSTDQRVVPSCGRPHSFLGLFCRIPPGGRGARRGDWVSPCSAVWDVLESGPGPVLKAQLAPGGGRCLGRCGEGGKIPQLPHPPPAPVLVWGEQLVFSWRDLS